MITNNLYASLGQNSTRFCTPFNNCWSEPCGETKLLCRQQRRHFLKHWFAFHLISSKEQPKWNKRRTKTNFTVENFSQWHLCFDTTLCKFH